MRKEMGKSLLIVESPAKARTIHKILGKEFMVKASVGHIKDLPENRLGVDIKRNFTPQYVIIKGKEKVIRELKALSRKAERIYLAPDPDREGEAIAWHIAEEVGDGKEIHRLLIHEVTPRGIREALKNPRELQESLYRAQQARRILDRLVGYKLSPLLWQKVKRGLSAGRVQSVALRLICEREKEIRDFVPQEYWSITAELRHPSSTSPFEARLTRIQGKKAEIPDGGRAQAIISSLRGERFIVERVQRKERRRNPPPPFITSTLQQEASRRLRFSVKKTMAIAQQLYEGVELGELGRVGLITYMRTDSVRIAPEAIEGVRKAIVRLFGEDYLPKGPNRFRSRKGAQEAHEAIRPASFDLPPEKVKPHLSRDQFLLYKLIWDRFLACQMKEALIDQTTVEIKAGECLFTATGHLLKFPGFLIVYEEKGEDEEEGILPPMKEGDELELIELVPKQHFTQPPPRYTESSLVKELEEKGIGRPSTYATIITTLLERGYVELKDRKFHPTSLGLLVSELLVESFPAIMDVGFTARMEEKLDDIEAERVSWTEVLEEFYRSFSQDLQKAEREMREVRKERIPTDIRCELCGSPMEIRWGKYGEFLSCSAFPQCKNAKMFVRDEEGRIRIVKESTDERCPKCGGPMVVKEGKFGRFLACERYPECDGTKPLGTGVKCPVEGCGGEIVERRTRKGRTFYGCSRYPECNFVLWQRPVPRPCPQCGSPYLLEARRRGKTLLICPDKGCGYEEERGS